MKEKILEQHSRLRRSDKYNINEMVDVLLSIMATLNSNLMILQEDRVPNIYEREDQSQTVSLFVTDDPMVTSSENANGFIKIGVNELELQYFGHTVDDISVVIVEQNEMGPVVKAFIEDTFNGQPVTIQIMGNHILVDDQVMTLSPSLSAMDIAFTLDEVVRKLREKQTENTSQRK